MFSVRSRTCPNYPGVSPAAIKDVELTRARQPIVGRLSLADSLEAEADPMAEAVMMMPEPTWNLARGAAAPGTVQRKCAVCEEEEEAIQRKPLAASITPFIHSKLAEVGTTRSDRSSIVAPFARNASRSSGEALNPDVVPALGNDQRRPLPQFSRQTSNIVNAVDLPAAGGRSLEAPVARRLGIADSMLARVVRIHDGAAAAEAASRAGAAAMTSGADIYFANGAYRPQTGSGLELLAHELVHVVQQHQPGGPPPGYQSAPGDVWEREADARAREMVLPYSDAQWTPRTGAVQRRTAAEQIATVLRRAAEGWGTDEDAIFTALTGRSQQELADIQAAYVALSGGETLEYMLRDELSGDDLARALSLLQGESGASETARRIWDAVRGWGTDEESIYAAVAGRTTEEWTAVQEAYERMAGEPLMTRLADELSSEEMQHLQALLPGAVGGAVTPEDRATVAANQIRAAVDGLGTDEDAIYSALTGRTEPELAEIQRRFRLLTGEALEARLQSELSDSDFARAARLLHPEVAPTRLARELRHAVEGPGTGEGTINGVLAGRTPAELAMIRAEYMRLYGESIQDRLHDELSGSELLESAILERTGVLAPADEIKVAIRGAGTDEERLFAVLREIGVTAALVEQTIDAYRAKGYGDMLQDIREDLSGDDLARAMELLHASVPTGACTPDERKTVLLSINGAIALAEDAVARLDADIAAARLSSSVTAAIQTNFNGANVPGAVTLGLAGQVRAPLAAARIELLRVANINCGPIAPCVANPSCTLFTAAWTLRLAAHTVQVCPAFFTCDSEGGEAVTMLHEFIHHSGIHDKAYHHDSAFGALTPAAALDNCDSFAYFAKDVQ